MTNKINKEIDLNRAKSIFERNAMSVELVIQNQEQIQPKTLLKIIENCQSINERLSLIILTDQAFHNESFPAEVQFEKITDYLNVAEEFVFQVESFLKEIEVNNE